MINPNTPILIIAPTVDNEEKEETVAAAEFILSSITAAVLIEKLLVFSLHGFKSLGNTVFSPILISSPPIVNFVLFVA